MDILKEIESQINSIKKQDNSNFLDSIFIHIDRAEYYYVQGKSDTNYFNDVIYRSNQAYEGALKESYKVLAEKSDEQVHRKTPNEIEKYFEQENIFKERVLELFKNYRQEWRNKSTHDFKLFFDENEAFIALTSVSSFVHLLLKQIQEKISYNIQQQKLEKEKEKRDEILKITSSENKTPITKLIELLIEFAEQNSNYIYNNPDIKEYEIMGLLQAHLNIANKTIDVQREPNFTINQLAIRPDFYLDIDDEEIILEIKRFRQYRESAIVNSVNQMLVYMQATRTKDSVIYIPLFSEEKTEPKIETREQVLNGDKYTVTIVTT